MKVILLQDVKKIGKKINIQEGAQIVGEATVTKIFNPILLKE